MKKIFRISALIIAVFFFMNETKAQVRVQPRQGQNAGNYYYFPEIDSWYDILNRRFIYFEYGRWVFSRQLSNKYRDYDVNNGYKVLVDETRPYVHANRYRERYLQYYTAYNNRLPNQVVLTGTRVYKDDRLNERARMQERSRAEDRTPWENRHVPERNISKDYEASKNIKIQEVEEPVEAEVPAHIEEHKSLDRGQIQSREHTHIQTNKTDVRAKEDSRARFEPVKKEPDAPVKVQEPVKTDTVPAIKRVPIVPGGSREAQYSEKYKKQIGGD